MKKIINCVRKIIKFDKAKPICIGLSLIMCYLVVYYSVDRFSAVIPVSTANPQTEKVIVLDAGHGGYVLSLVA